MGESPKRTRESPGHESPAKHPRTSSTSPPNGQGTSTSPVERNTQQRPGDDSEEGQEWDAFDVRGQYSGETTNKDAEEVSGEINGEAVVNRRGHILGSAAIRPDDRSGVDVDFELQTKKRGRSGRNGRSNGSFSGSRNAGTRGISPSTLPRGPNGPNDQISSESDDSKNSNDATGRGFLEEAPARETSSSCSSENTSEKGDSADTAPTDTKEFDFQEGSKAKDDYKRSDSSSEPQSLGSAPVNQAPFIQKLYLMLEDPKLYHVIRWAPSYDRFYINPNEDFAQILCLYFKHGNISSFVRQLSMYGFHKVSKSNSQRNKWFPWEFRHMDGAFKRGNAESLRTIRRRNTRQINGKRIKYVALAGDVKQEPDYSSPQPATVAPTPNMSTRMYPSTPRPGAHTHHPPLGPNQPNQPNQPFSFGHNGQTQQPNGFYNGSTIPKLEEFSRSNSTLNGSTPMNGSALSATSTADPTNTREQIIHLMRSQQAVQSQLMMIQETIGRLTSNVHDMGASIDRLLTQQPAIGGPLPPQSQILPENTLASLPQHQHDIYKYSNGINGKSQVDDPGRRNLRDLLN